MKKISGLLLMLAVLMLAACGAEEEAGKESATAEDPQESSEEQATEVDEEGFSVEITIPASQLEGQDIDQAIADATEEGKTEAVKNDDGSVTYKMTESAHQEMMLEVEGTILDTAEAMLNNEEFVSIQDITYSDSYDEFTVTVDKEAYEKTLESYGVLTLAMGGMIYQVYDGVDADSAKVNVTVIAEATGEEIQSYVYPSDFDEVEEE